MQCPKCGHQQDNTVGCEACGIFFAKYQNRQQQTTHTVIHVERKRSYTWPIAGSIAAGVLIGAYFFHGPSATPPASQTQITKQQTIFSPYPEVLTRPCYIYPLRYQCNGYTHPHRTCDNASLTHACGVLSHP